MRVSSKELFSTLKNLYIKFMLLCQSFNTSKEISPRLGKSAGFLAPSQCFHVMFNPSEISWMADTLFATHEVHECAGFWSQCHVVILSVQAKIFMVLIRNSLHTNSTHCEPRKAACSSSRAIVIVFRGATFPFENNKQDLLAWHR